jgi:hypothetical protein
MVRSPGADACLRMCRRQLVGHGITGGARKRERCLAKKILPTGRRTNIRVTEPDASVEADPFVGPFDSKERGYDPRVTAYADGLGTGLFVLNVVRQQLLARFAKLILAREYPTVSKNEDHVGMQNRSHRLGIVLLDCRLKCAIKLSDKPAIRVRIRHCATAHKHRRQR